MKLMNFYEGGALHVGLVMGERVADLTACDPDLCRSMERLIAAGEEGLARAAALAKTAPRKPLPGAAFAPAVTAPEKILCVGLNYMSHIAEEKEARPPFPEVFGKYNNALAAHGETIPLPGAAGGFDYEAELVAVIGKTACRVPEERALEYVFGYTCGNDISAREQQFRVTQWLVGKSCDGFAPVGPWIVTRDAINAASLEIRLWRNGALRQCDNTRNLIYGVPALVSYLSQYMTLRPGDLIFTGTCAGCITGITDENGAHPWLSPGDEVVVEIEGIGRLRNVMG